MTLSAQIANSIDTNSVDTKPLSKQSSSTKTNGADSAAAQSNSTKLQSDTLSSQDISDLTWQRRIGWLLFYPLSVISVLLIRYKYKFSIKSLDSIRQQFKELVKSKKPVLVCCNHLTLVDSVIIIWALASLKDYLLNYRLFCWNVPEIKNFCKKPTWRLFTYLGKCIPIDRDGTREHQDNVLEKVSSLIRIGDLCMVFPEGTRSRYGRVIPEDVTYGVGKIVRNVPGCQVLCMYLRGDRQETYSDFPKKGEDFYLKMEMITPTTKSNGLRAIRDYSVQIISKIKELEEEYFSLKGNPGKALD